MERDAAPAWFLAKATLALALLSGVVVAWGLRAWGAGHGASPERLAGLGDLGTVLIAAVAVLFGAHLATERRDRWRGRGLSIAGSGLLLLAARYDGAGWTASALPWLVLAIVVDFGVVAAADRADRRRRLDPAGDGQEEG